jgi:hypothetical protein
MKNKLLNGMLAALLVCGASVTRATDNGGGPPGGSSGSGFFCKLWCELRHGSCQIPSGDPDVPPLHDPFCAQRKADCKAGCGGGSGGGGGIIIGSVTPDARAGWLMSPLPACAPGDAPGSPS